jgi:hypothetical protein
MVNESDIPQANVTGSLAREAVMFFVHTLVAAIFLAVAIGALSLNNPDPDSPMPKLLGTVLAFLVPLIASFLLGRVYRSEVAGRIWVSGLILFLIACVAAFNLPTGPGLCESCGTTEKLWRTFFTFNNGSGLMGGDGLLIGAWIPLSMFGYAIGAKLAR